MTGIAPILIAYDGSPDARHAIEETARLFPRAIAVVLYARRPLGSLAAHLEGHPRAGRPARHRRQDLRRLGTAGHRGRRSRSPPGTEGRTAGRLDPRGECRQGHRGRRGGDRRLARRDGLTWPARAAGTPRGQHLHPRHAHLGQAHPGHPVQNPGGGSPSRPALKCLLHASGPRLRNSRSRGASSDRRIQGSAGSHVAFQHQSPRKAKSLRATKHTHLVVPYNKIVVWSNHDGWA